MLGEADRGVFIMYTFELVTEIPAGQERAWSTLTQLAEWSRWNRLVPSAAGALQPGVQLDLQIRGSNGDLRPFRPVVVAITPPRELILEAWLGRRWLVRMLHTFSIEQRGPDAARLRQRWVASGLFVPVIWPILRRNMVRFTEFGSDLALEVAQPAHLPLR